MQSIVLNLIDIRSKEDLYEYLGSRLNNLPNDVPEIHREYNWDAYIDFFSSLMFHNPEEPLELELVNFHEFIRKQEELAKEFLTCTSLAISGATTGDFWEEGDTKKVYIRITS